MIANRSKHRYPALSVVFELLAPVRLLGNVIETKAYGICEGGGSRFDIAEVDITNVKLLQLCNPANYDSFYFLKKVFISEKLACQGHFCTVVSSPPITRLSLSSSAGPLLVAL